MNPPTRRLNYFDHQFLHVDDFADEQAYHLGMRRAHNALLHAWGVAYGLTLSHAGSRVMVSPGVALDSSGREIVLDAVRDLQVPVAMAGTTAYVVLAYDERDADFTSETGASGYRRREEIPSLVLADAAPADPSTRLVLGRVTVDASGGVASTDDGEGASRRRTAGPAPITELEVSRLEVTGTARLAGGHDDLAAGEGDLRVGNGTHRLKVGVTLIGGAAGDVRLRAHGGTGRLLLGSGTADVLAVQGGGVGIGTGSAAPDATLHVAGGRVFASTDGDLKVGTGTNRLKVGVEVAGTAAGTARLRAEGTAPKLVLGAAGADVLTVSGTGVGIAAAPTGDATLNVNGRLRLGNASASQGAGVLLSHDGTDQAFLGLASANLLSLYAPAFGSPALRVDLTTGHVGLRTDPAASGGAALTVNGGLAVSGTATVSGLLTASNGLTVSSGRLTASGGLTVTGTATVSGLLTASNALTVSSGRLTASGGLTVTGTATVSSLLTASGGLTVTGTATVSGLLTASNGLTVSAGKVGIGVVPGEVLDVADRIRLRQGAGGTAGMWLYNTTPASDRAFVGMNGDDVVGFYGNAGGIWGLTVHVALGNVGVRSIPTATDALYINGRMTATGSKNFRIRHPLDADRDLVHACLEGPEVGVYYRGTARLEDGRATIRLPEYFEALTRPEDRTVQLTARGRDPFALSHGGVADGAFEAFGARADGEFDWEVRAVRADVPPLDVEVPTETG
jgi:hypothetical protein